MSTELDQYAVFGNPIKHSLSPEIHTAFAKQTSQAMEYNKTLVEKNGFTAATEAFFAAGGSGLNITLPFKLDAYRYANSLSKRARQAGAVNTLIKQDDGLVLGDNTDGAGLVADICTNLGWQLRDKKLLVLGAGGAVRGVLVPLLNQSPAVLIVANRTVEKAQSLATAFAGSGPIQAASFDELKGQQFDLVINGTSASLSGDLPPLPENLLMEEACCYDMMYGVNPTPFLVWATDQGAARTADGLGMLVEQAAEAFRLWRGVQPKSTEVITNLRRKL